MIDKCPQRFQSVFLYFEHLTTLHKVPRIYRFECTFDGCHQVLANWYVFKRHVLGHQEEHGIQQAACQSGPSIRRTNHNASKDPRTTSPENHQHDANTSEHPDNTQGAEALDNTDREEIYKAAVEITLELYSETNLSR